MRSSPRSRRLPGTGKQSERQKYLIISKFILVFSRTGARVTPIFSPYQACQTQGFETDKINLKKSASVTESAGLKKTMLSCYCFLHGKNVKPPAGPCKIQQLYAALQMVDTQTLSASRRASDPSQRPLTRLCTSPPIGPDRSIPAVPQEAGRGSVCSRRLSVSHSSVTWDENELWLHSCACHCHNNTFVHLLAFCVQTSALHVGLRSRPDAFHRSSIEPGGLFWPLRGRKEDEVSGNTEHMGNLHEKTREHPPSEQIKGRAPIQNCPRRSQEVQITPFRERRLPQAPRV